MSQSVMTHLHKMSRGSLFVACKMVKLVKISFAAEADNLGSIPEAHLIGES